MLVCVVFYARSGVMWRPVNTRGHAHSRTQQLPLQLILNLLPRMLQRWLSKGAMPSLQKTSPISIRAQPWQRLLQIVNGPQAKQH